jgi:hypothetical protein
MVGRLRVRSLAGVGRTCPKPSGRSGSGLAPTRQTADALDVGAGAGAGVAPAGGEAVAGPAGTATEDGLGLALGCVDGWAAQAATNAPSTRAISRRTPRSMRSRVPRSGRHGWQLVAHPGRRDELVAGIRELKDADGCDLYVVSREVEDRNTIWVVEAPAALGQVPCGPGWRRWRLRPRPAAGCGRRSSGRPSGFRSRVGRRAGSAIGESASAGWPPGAADQPGRTWHRSRFSVAARVVGLRSGSVDHSAHHSSAQRSKVSWPRRRPRQAPRAISSRFSA